MSNPPSCKLSSAVSASCSALQSSASRGCHAAVAAPGAGKQMRSSPSIVAAQGPSPATPDSSPQEVTPLVMVMPPCSAWCWVAGRGQPCELGVCAASPSVSGAPGLQTTCWRLSGVPLQPVRAPGSSMLLSRWLLFFIGTKLCPSCIHLTGVKLLTRHGGTLCSAAGGSSSPSATRSCFRQSTC